MDFFFAFLTIFAVYKVVKYADKKSQEAADKARQAKEARDAEEKQKIEMAEKEKLRVQQELEAQQREKEQRQRKEQEALAAQKAYEEAEIQRIADLERQNQREQERKKRIAIEKEKLAKERMRAEEQRERELKAENDAKERVERIKEWKALETKLIDANLYALSVDGLEKLTSKVNALSITNLLSTTASIEIDGRAKKLAELEKYGIKTAKHNNDQYQFLVETDNHEIEFASFVYREKIPRNHLLRIDGKEIWDTPSYRKSYRYFGFLLQDGFTLLNGLKVQNPLLATISVPQIPLELTNIDSTHAKELYDSVSPHLAYQKGRHNAHTLIHAIHKISK